LVMVIAFFGIASIMNLLVQEKTREIGMLMALGSSRANIRNIFLYESGILGLIGAVSGCILGFAGTFGLGSLKFELAAGGREITSLPLILNPWDFIGFTILAVGLSLVAGVYPAIKASQLDPVIALKGG
jgi:lipoprotein-releasing system permease protein